MVSGEITQESNILPVNITRDEEVPTIEKARRHIIADDRSEGAWAIERQHVRRGLSAKQLTHGNQWVISSLKQMTSHSELSASAAEQSS